MVTFNNMKIPEQIFDKIVDGEKPRELYELSWLTFIRPDPRDVTAKMPGVASCYVWAKDADDARDQLRKNPPTLDVNGDDQELPIIVMQAVVPVKPGISEEALLEIVPQEPHSVEEAN